MKSVILIFFLIIIIEEVEMIFFMKIGITMVGVMIMIVEEIVVEMENGVYFDINKC